MPELRKDPIVGRWVIIATERGKRPSDFDRIEMPRKGGFCPFCPGNESKTPPEVYADREPGSPRDGPGWYVRVVSNKFPALQIEGDLKRRGEGMYDKMNGVGAHEVIIESPAHETDTSELPLIQIERVLVALRERMLDLAKDKRFRYVQVFKNRGDAAGASLEHSHTQLIATPIIPASRRRGTQRLRAATFWRRNDASTATSSTRSRTTRSGSSARTSTSSSSSRSPPASRSRRGSCRNTMPSTSRKRRSPRSRAWRRS